MPGLPDYQHVLLAKARQDAEAADAMSDDDRYSDEIVGFHCQQAVEKAIKAVLEARGTEFPLTHDLVLLLELLERAPVNCPVSMDEASMLNQFAVRFRYDLLPVMSPAAPLDRSHARSLATLAVKWAGTFVNQDDRGET